MESDIEINQSVPQPTNKPSFLRNPPINAEETLSPLQFAALRNGVEACQVLVENGADVHAECQDSGATLMHLAASNGTNGPDLIDWFASLGLDEGAKDRFGEEPIHYAIKAKNLEVAEFLLKRRHHDQNNLLHFCVMDNNLELVKIVLQSDEEMLGRDTMHLAARHADPSMCRWLVDRGADAQALGEDQDTSLHSAALNGAHGTQLVSFLVTELGLDVNARNELELTPLHLALQSELVEVAEALVALGADLDVTANTESLLEFCQRRGKPKSVAFLQAKTQGREKKIEKVRVQSGEVPVSESSPLIDGLAILAEGVVFAAVGIAVFSIVNRWL